MHRSRRPHTSYLSPEQILLQDAPWSSWVDCELGSRKPSEKKKGRKKKPLQKWFHSQCITFLLNGMCKHLILTNRLHGIRVVGNAGVFGGRQGK